MNRKYSYLIMALTFLSFFLILIFFIRNKPELEATQDVQIESPPFSTYISGIGVVEPTSGNIIIGSPFNRVVEKINVSISDKVKKGEILFEVYNQG